MALSSRAEITLAPLFKDHAVVQRDKPLPIWGRATPGEKLSVTFHQQVVTTTADRDGRWIVYLELSRLIIVSSALLYVYFNPVLILLGLVTLIIMICYFGTIQKHYLKLVYANERE